MLKVKGMPFFHVLAGCDTVPAFCNKGKKKLLGRHGAYVQKPRLYSCDLEILEKFVILMYDRSGTAATMIEARFDMFARKQRPYEPVPPTRAALLQQTRRAACQAGCVWAQATQCQPEAEDPADWGWEKVFWTATSPTAKTFQQFN